jgi:hypothetical protein
MTKFSEQKRRERIAAAPVAIPRALFMRGGGWTHAQPDILPRSPMLVLLAIAASTIALGVLGGYALVNMAK